MSQLSAHIPVDIYGACGNHSCGKTRREKAACDAIMADSKFYLSFENSLCTDYMTEKVWKVLLLRPGTVPVVLGGADYSLHLPPHSYIDVADFSSPRDLALYLLHLDRHEEEYQRYFWWREHYTTIRNNWAEVRQTTELL